MRRNHPSVCLKMALLFVVAVILMLPQAEGIVRRHDVDEQEYIDLGGSFPAAGLFLHNTSPQGSGVLISETGVGASEWVLTAAHINTPNFFNINGVNYDVAEMIRHPGFGGSTGGPPGSGLADDIALVRLTEPVVGVTPMRWHDDDADLQAGVEVFTVGLGLSGTGLTGEEGTSGTRRAAENTIFARGAQSPQTPIPTAFTYRFHAPTDSDVRPLEGMAVFLDSGGPVIADFGGDVVIGVHSYVDDRDGGGRGTYGDDVGSTRVPLYDEWILGTIPEPNTITLLGLAVIALYAWRRSFQAL